MNKKIKFAFLALLTTVSIPFSAVADQGKDYKEIIKSDPDSSYIFLFVYRSATYLDWSNPSDLAKTTLVSQITRRLKNDASSIGHAQIGWSCNEGNGHIISGATGQTGQNGSEGFQIVKNGGGLSVLDTVFTDGSLETENEVIEKMKKADEHNNFAWLAIKTNYSSCSEMAKFVSDYDKSGAAINYGFPVEPLKFQGAGCTSFANASISKAHLANMPLSKAWVRHIKIPLKYVGKLSETLPNTRPLEVAKDKASEKLVPMSDFLFKKIEWAGENDEYKDFYYYDPELFYESLVDLENRYREHAGMVLKNPIRTKTFDETELHTKKISEEWMDKLLSDYKRVKMDKIYNTTGLVVEP